ncbi:MAG: hypothetical protein AAF367_07875 [Pseudomonadota bacterium]
MPLSLPVFILGSASFYAVAMIALKILGQGGPKVAVAFVIAATVFGGLWMEFEALKSERLGLIYVAILGAECLIIALASSLLFGESFSTRELAGGALIVGGIALALV